MTIFEDDAINDDFEVEITDLDPENEVHPLSSAIAVLRSRISFKARSNEAEDASPDDDFEVEITDLPGSDEESGFPAAIAALRSYISLRPRLQEFSDEVVDDDFEVEITDLPTTNDADDATAAEGAIKEMDREGDLPAHEKGGREGKTRHLNINSELLHSRLPRKTRFLWRAIVGVAVLLMLGVVLESIPSSRDALLGLFPRPTPTPTAATISREFGRFRSSYSETIVIAGDISISSTPIAGVPVPSWNSNTPVANVLDPPPEACPSVSPPQDGDSVGYPYNNPIGGPPLWVLGFHGYPANLAGFIRATPLQYGWVRQITVMLAGTTGEAVMVSGARLQDGAPLLFRDPHSGQSPTTFLTLNPGISSVSDSDGDMIGGIAPISLYIPSAGCYYLKASWVGGSWEAIFAAGA